MKRRVVLGAIGLLLFTATGCGGPDALVKEFIVHLNGYAETLEKKESRDKQAAALERVKSTLEKIDKLKLSQEERDKLIAKNDGELKKAKERVESAQKTYLMDGGAATDFPDLFGGFVKPK
ncbi:hypothetical protein J8F10_26160 [Gemmata sp. G18]|uniref:OmpH family outer membrane protein n=1 Tax=Gemmata palustris TaxID=2822762 RepID=A0ABS5BZT5_9BACT|nr:hypothetical protein [Gemmata palustris]MBP3958745.1 hypothetical protein [Gemmata palustris]